jgi:glycosyltransferase involved in cell wall biosynthesis
MKKLSVVIIARNEEANLPRCLESVRWADEIIVGDSGSADRTVEVARDLGAKVYGYEWCGFGPAKQGAVDKAEGEWILSLDADEEVSPELASEIKAALEERTNIVGYYLPRRTEFLGRWMLHGGWYPDYVLRLFRKSRGAFTSSLVHEAVKVDGPTARLRNDLLHYSYPTLDRYFDKFNRYTTLAANEAFNMGQRVGLIELLLNPNAKFIKQYILKRGFLDGAKGLLLAILSSGYVSIKYAKLRELWRQKERDVN